MYVRNTKRNQRGMAATEYIIGLILVAVGAVGTFALFGEQVKKKLYQVTAAIGGDATRYGSAAKDDLSMSGSDAEVKKGNGMNNGGVLIDTKGAPAAGP